MNKVETFEVKERQALKIVALPGEHKYNVEKGHELEGKTYRRFTYLGDCFIANAEDKFCKDFDKGITYSIDIKREWDEENKKWLASLVGNTNIEQEVNMAESLLKLKKINAQSLALDVTEDELEQIEKGS